VLLYRAVPIEWGNRAGYLRICHEAAMLVEFYGANFGCFRDEFRLSLLATDIEPDSERGVLEVTVDGDDEPLRLLRMAAIYGPNASGKSTVVRAASALSYLLALSAQFTSDTPLAPHEPFAFGEQRDDGVTLGAVAVVDGVVYDYTLTFGRHTVRRERLKRLGAARPTVLFERVDQSVSGAWTDDEQFGLLTRSFRPNALLLSLADSLTPGLAGPIAVGLRRALHTTTALPVPWTAYRPRTVAERLKKDSLFREWLVAQLRTADVGVVDIDVRKVSRPAGDTDGADAVDAGGARRRLGASQYRIALMHAGHSGPVSLPYGRESHGTRRLIELSPELYDVAHGEPGALFVDEIDASLHPVLLDGLIRHLNAGLRMADVRGQLVFATHETALIDHEARDAALRRDQVYFTEKDNTGASRLYSVAEFRERNNLNMRRRYLQGRYGALPALGASEE
jgi:hypothetical protein